MSLVYQFKTCQSKFHTLSIVLSEFCFNLTTSRRINYYNNNTNDDLDLYSAFSLISHNHVQHTNTNKQHIIEQYQSNDIQWKYTFQSLPKYSNILTPILKEHLPYLFKAILGTTMAFFVLERVILTGLLTLIKLYR